MRTLDIITAKRNGQPLSIEAITSFIEGYANDVIPDYQMVALLMAIYFQGMSVEETAAMTLAMARSGKMLCLDDVPGIKVDKHSTGGVADTTTLVVAPLVAAAGVPVAKMSGRGLGFTGGTIDKLEAIPGFHAMLTETEFISNLQKHLLAVTGQTPDIAPADGKIYALRDATATVESIPLIASSIMSKKIAAGANKILLDVKVGSGAFMKTTEQAITLAETLVNIGEQLGRETVALLTNMDEPLGEAIGNSLEVDEAIDILSGHREGPLKEVCLLLGARMLVMAGKVKDAGMGINQLRALIDNGKALAKFQEFITAQGGDAAIVHKRELLPNAEVKYTVVSPRSGYVHRIDAAQLGQCSMLLGAGRAKKGETIDLAVGIALKCRVGDCIEQGQPIAIIHANDSSKIEVIERKIIAAIVIAEGFVAKLPVYLGIVDKYGFHRN